MMSDIELLLLDFCQHAQIDWSDEFQSWVVPWWDGVAGVWVIMPPPKKKPYSKPVLRIYGNIRNMTETSNRGSKSDHARRRSPHKTA